MDFRCFLETHENLKALKSNLDNALVDPKITHLLATLAQGDEKRLVTTLQKILAGENVFESTNFDLAKMIADYLQRYLGKESNPQKVIEIAKAAYQEFATEFMANYSPDKGSAVTALGVLGGMAGKRLKGMFKKSDSDLLPPPQSDL